MATTHTRSAARLMMAPSVILLFAWMIVPLGMTIYFSFLRYNLLMPGMEEFTGFPELPIRGVPNGFRIWLSPSITSEAAAIALGKPA